MDISTILRDLRENKARAKREEMEREPYLVPGGKAWRKRERAKQAKIDKEVEKVHARSVAQAKYYRKNRERLNAARAAYARMPHNVYKRAERRAKRRGQSWEFTFEEWQDLWHNAPRVPAPRTGFLTAAWNAKGGNFNTDTQMCRRDTSGPWSVENCFIGIAGKELGEENE